MISGREGFDAFTEDLRVFRHHKVLPLESLLLVLRQCLEDGVFLNEVVEFSELLIEFGFLIDYPLLVRCVCHWCLSLLRRLPAPNGEQGVAANGRQRPVRNSCLISPVAGLSVILNKFPCRSSVGCGETRGHSSFFARS
jgi:hypothetical protein